MNKYDVIGIGNTITDFQFSLTDDFFEKLNYTKGSMNLIELEKRKELFKILDKIVYKQSSGGSVANSLSGLSKLGIKSAMIGCVGYDEIGKKYTQDLENLNIDFISKPSQGDSGTCIVLITPDGERTMLTTLGCSPFLKEELISEKAISTAKIVYIEGYLWDSPITINVVKKIIELAKRNQTKIAFSTSDMFCVDRHKDDFIKLIENDIDILFCNEQEAIAIYGDKYKEIYKISDQLKKQCEFVAITLGSRGSILSRNFGENSVNISAVDCQVLDTTGAGDAYAAGVLHGIIKGNNLFEIGNNASKIASEVISKIGARWE